MRINSVTIFRCLRNLFTCVDEPEITKKEIERIKMPKGIVIYYSRTGNTEEMAQIIAKAMNETGLPTECKSISEIEPTNVFDYDAIVIGSPTYYGQMAAQIKHLIDDLVVCFRPFFA